MFKSLLQLASVLGLGTTVLNNYPKVTAAEGSCKVCMSIEICPDVNIQDALCRDECGEGSFSVGNCGTPEGNFGCYVAQSGWGCTP